MALFQDGLTQPLLMTAVRDWGLGISIRFMFAAGVEVQAHLVYIGCYTAVHRSPPNHLLYKTSRMKDHHGERISSIIPLANIRRSILFLSSDHLRQRKGMDK
ncbi:hypothetical protein BYT27DRAFT_6854192 [Phlegmacium glaucopus]|nr:hypothetical protein BYT27DRAFT_6854192 [Phlegmacium glaucopus]